MSCSSRFSTLTPLVRSLKSQTPKYTKLKPFLFWNSVTLDLTVREKGNFAFRMSVHRKHISKVQPKRCNFFSIYLFLWIALHVSGGSSAHHQEHKTVNTASASGIVKPMLLPAAIVDEMEAVCTVLCSWWWAEEPPETCRAIHRNK